MSVILGIDPGSRITGYGIIGLRNKKPYYIVSGCIVMKPETVAQKLKQIFEEISQICQQYQPQVAAIEQVFMHRNVSAALKLGQARGAAIAAMSCYNLSVNEYSARQIKQAVVGYGAAAKEQVQHMMMQLLALEQKPANDAADALAVALCHAHNYLGQQALQKRVE